MALVSRGVYLTSRLLFGCALLAIAAMAAHIGAEIVARTFFSRSLDGTIQVVSHYYMVAIIFLPWAAVYGGNHMLVSEVVSSRLGDATNAFLDKLSHFLMACWLGVFAWVTGEAAMHRTRTQEFVETTYDIFTVWPSRWFLPIGAGAAALYAILMLFERKRELPEEPISEA